MLFHAQILGSAGLDQALVDTPDSLDHSVATVDEEDFETLGLGVGDKTRPGQLRTPGLVERFILTPQSPFGCGGGFYRPYRTSVPGLGGALPAARALDNSLPAALFLAPVKPPIATASTYSRQV